MGRIKETLTIAALAGCCYELYLFISFRFYMKYKINFYKKRRKRFIVEIQSDFRDVIVPSVIEDVDRGSQSTAESEQVLQSAY
jgi:CRISPR/Cas system-associated exonuclease Cas4 (RecB family)